MIFLFAIQREDQVLKISCSTFAPQIDWISFLNAQFQLVNITLLETEMVVVNGPDYIRNMCSILETHLRTEAGREKIHNFMLWGVVYSSISLLSEEFANAYDRFLKVYKGGYAPTC